MPTLAPVQTSARTNCAVRRLFAVASFCFLAACSPTPTPPPPTATISPALIEAAAEFCPMPRGWVIYLTQPGDSLGSLARRTSSTTAELATANCLNNPRALDSGLVFYLPRQPVGR